MFRKLLTFLRSAKAQNEAAAHIAGYDEAAGRLLRSVIVGHQIFQHSLDDLKAEADAYPESHYGRGMLAACSDFEAVLVSRSLRTKSSVIS